VNQESQVYAFRRHRKGCKYFGPGGREVRADKCSCPFHVDGIYNGKRIRRRSLKTRNRQIAERQVAKLVRTLDGELAQPRMAATEETVPAPAQRTVSDAVESFLKSRGEVREGGKYRGDLAYGSWRKYRTSLEKLVSFCDVGRISKLADVTMDTLEGFHRTRSIGLVTWKVELQTLRTFFGYCVSHKWIVENPAKELKPPRNIKPNEVVPYTLQDESQILAACETFGARNQRTEAIYERLRARAMVMALRHTALRVSDVATLQKHAISWDRDNKTWRVMLRTQKSGEPVYLPIPESLKLALDALPLPRNADQECPYYFWNGHTSRRAVVGIAERTLGTVFKKSGVKNAHAHRFRHTLATRLLEQGATFEQVADILGNSPDVVRKHYGKWSKARQANIDRLMFAHFATASVTSPVTPQSHEKTGPVN
jgi:site-specific recombinase XerD